MSYQFIGDRSFASIPEPPPEIVDITAEESEEEDPETIDLEETGNTETIDLEETGNTEEEVIEEVEVRDVIEENLEQDTKFAAGVEGELEVEDEILEFSRFLEEDDGKEKALKITEAPSPRPTVKQTPIVEEIITTTKSPPPTIQRVPIITTPETSPKIEALISGTRPSPRNSSARIVTLWDIMNSSDEGEEQQQQSSKGVPMACPMCVKSFGFRFGLINHMCSVHFPEEIAEAYAATVGVNKYTVLMAEDDQR